MPYISAVACAEYALRTPKDGSKSCDAGTCELRCDPGFTFYDSATEELEYKCVGGEMTNDMYATYVPDCVCKYN